VLANAVSYAESKGALVVAAAGNEGSTAGNFPAAYASVVGVAASNSSDHRYSWSNHGSWVSVAAPGCSVSTELGGGYSTMCGTSASAPMVAGALALARSLAPSASPSELRAGLNATAVPVGSWVAAGRIDAGANLTALGSSTVPDPAPKPSDPEPTPEPEPTPQPEPVEPEPVVEPEPEPELSPATACPAEALTSAFTDVVADSVHAPGISCLAWWGIASGAGDGTYGPARSLQRAQAASLLARAIGVATHPLPAGPHRFDDIAGSVHRDNIEALAGAGIVDSRRL
jgi:subtilisin family serine protease